MTESLRLPPRAAAVTRVGHGCDARRRALCPRPRSAHPTRALRPLAAVARETDPTTTATPAPVVYQGAYGPWSVEPADIAEVRAYRAGLAVAAGAGAAAVGCATLPSLQAWAATQPDAVNAACGAGLAGFGLSLSLLHLYVAPLKKVLLGLFGAGTVGAAALAATHPGTGLPALVAASPAAVWAVGPAAAAATGLAIKEGLCYGKAECAILAALLPAASLAHLSGVAPPGLAGALADAAAVTGLLWVARKVTTQPLVEDIGDKSVFTFRDLPPEGQAAVLARLRAEAAGAGAGEE
jgi:uncharacterized integral membrane protein